MANEGIFWQAIQLPFSGGLQQRYDDRVRPQPFLDICRDVQFDETGGVQTRYPFADASGDIFGGGTISNARRIVPNGSELVLFTKDTLYSWNAQLSKWVSKGTHLAVAVDEQTRFASTGDQIDGDRAELSGTVVVTWSESLAVYAAAYDKTTGSVLVSPTLVASNAVRPRLVALASKILLFTYLFGSSALNVRAIDPAAPATGLGGAATSVLASNANGNYDVVKVDGQDLAIGVSGRSTTTSYNVFKVTSALAVTTATKARTADGAIAVATIPGGTQAQVVRVVNSATINLTAVQGDLLTTSTLADVFTAQAIGNAVISPVNQIAIEFSSVSSGGNYTAHVFWHANEVIDTAGDYKTKHNTVTNANAVGSQGDFVLSAGVASRAFDYNGSVYVWLVFASQSRVSGTNVPTAIQAQLQNTYFLYRSDGLLVSKAAFEQAGGLARTGHLPGVTLTSGSTTFSWCGSVRRAIDLGGKAYTGFGARSPRDVSFTFDSNDARRCVRLGGTLYISGGLIKQYDGASLVEVGFVVYPWYMIASSGLAATGAIPAGDYDYKSTLSWRNAAGERERLTTATQEKVTAASLTKLSVALQSLHVTLKTSTRNPPASELWRTAVDPPDGAPLYKVSSDDPTVASGDNRYVANDPTIFDNPAGGFSDNFTDDTLTIKEQFPENGGELERLAPIGAAIILAIDTRLFLFGVAGDPDRGYYSRQRNDGEIASFNDQLKFDIPAYGGRVTAAAAPDETLVVFREHAIYAMPGSGLDNLGQGQNYGPARTISLDVGAVGQEAVALTPVGLVFKSSKGWYLYRSNGSLEYIGAAVVDFDAETVLSIDVVEKQHQVRILTAARMIVWDYLVNQWGEWTISDGIHSCIYAGTHVYLTSFGTRSQLTTYTGLTYGFDIETSWIKPANLTADAQNDRAVGGQGDGRVRKLQPLGEYLSDHLLRFRVAYNYDGTYIDDKAWSPSPTVAGGALQVAHGTKRPRCQAIKLRLTAVAVDAMANLIAFIDFDVDSTSLVTIDGDTRWSAFLLANAPGEMGNAVTMSIDFEPGDGAASFDVRDHFTWDRDAQSWTADANNVGILVRLNLDDPPTTTDLENAITAASTLCTIAGEGDGAVIDVATMLASERITASFSRGTYTSPTGGALKLTGLGMEVGLEQGLYRRIAPAQRQ